MNTSQLAALARERDPRVPGPIIQRGGSMRQNLLVSVLRNLFGKRQKLTRQMLRKQQREAEKSRTHSFKRSVLTSHIAARL